MSAHTPLESREDWQKAVNGHPGKYVFIYAYQGDVSPQAEEYAMKFKDRVASYKVDVEKQEMAKKSMGMSKYPSAIVYKDGEEVKKVEGMEPNGMKEIGMMLSSA